MKIYLTQLEECVPLTNITSIPVFPTLFWRRLGRLTPIMITVTYNTLKEVGLDYELRISQTSDCMNCQTCTAMRPKVVTNSTIKPMRNNRYINDL